jgi:hypothetical protein
MINLVTGSVPRGPDYFGRDDSICRLWGQLENDHVLLVAPRRFGKTGAMFRLLDQPREPYHPIYIDLEHLASPADFMVELLATLRRDNHFARAVNGLWEETKQVGRYLRGLASRVDLGSLKVYLREQTDVAQQWRAYGERVMQTLADDEPRLLLMLDEFAILVHQAAQRDLEELKQFLRWFRAARIAPDTKTRFLVGGSINLVSTLDAVGLVDTVNDFAVQRLGPFDAETAREFIQAVSESRGIELRDDVQDCIVNTLGSPIPYLLSVLLTAVLNHHRTSGSAITPELVQSAFENDVLGGATPFFYHYYSRLREYYSAKEARAAKAILGLLSRSDAPVRKDTLYQLFLKELGLQPNPEVAEEFQRLMQKLDNDFYVSTRDDTYEFASRAIQLWWRNSYGFQTA